MTVSQYSVLAEALKVVLKSKGVSYNQLASRISMSESGVKKLLTAKDASINRLESICSALGLTLLDLVQTATVEHPVYEFSLPQNVQEFFVANLDCFFVYWKLCYEEIAVGDIADSLSIDSAKLKKHIRQLDRFGLLTVGADDKITLPKRRHHLWVGDGPLVSWLRRNWTTQVLEKAIASPNDHEHRLSLRYLRVTSATRNEFLQSVADLLKEFGDRSLRERLIHSDSSLSDTRVLFAAVPGSFIDSNISKFKKTNLGEKK